MQSTFERRLNELTKTSLLETAFTVRHLPGYIFVTASPTNILSAHKKVSTPECRLPQPIPMQRDEWHGSLNALPWLDHYISPGSWAIIQDYSERFEKGKLAYVLGSCQETQFSIVAIIPDQPPFDKTLLKEQLKGPINQRHMAARQAAFQNDVTLAKSRFLASEEEDRIAEATRRFENMRSEIKKRVVSSTERIEQLADLKRAEEAETAWSISESRMLRPRKVGKATAPRLWSPEEYEETQKVFRVSYNGGTPFTEAFAGKFKLPKVSRPYANSAELEVEIVEMNTQTFDWAYTETSDYVIHEYLGRLYLRGLRIIPIFFPDSLQPVTVPPFDEQFHAFVDSYMHRTVIHRLFSLYHWKHGDKIGYQNEIYLLGVVDLEEGSVTGRKVNTNFSGEARDQVQDFPMPIHEVERIFCIGDSIEITAGRHKGQNGTLFLEETKGNLTIWITLSDEDIPVSFSNLNCRLNLTPFLQDHHFRFTLPRHFMPCDLKRKREEDKGWQPSAGYIRSISSFKRRGFSYYRWTYLLSMR